jgi:hypothetical protein
MFFHPISNFSVTLWPLIVVLLTATAASAQPAACSLRIDQLPAAAELRGFRLGMTYDQVKALVPQVKFGPADQFGVAKTSINPYFDPRIDKVAFADVRTISLDFLDGKLVGFWIGFESTFKWQTLDAFVAGISKPLNLPAEWSNKRTGRQVSCEGFSLFASVIAGSPSIRISDDDAQETIATRREEAAAAAEATEAMVIGDQRTKLFYPSDCSALQSVTKLNRIKFKDKDEAEKAGFRPAKDCQ